MTSRTAGADSFTYSYGAAGPHAVTGMDLNGTPYTYAYDANGNMTASTDFTDPANPAPRTLTWNADNMPLSVTRSGVTTSFTYDGMGRRAKKQVGSANLTYYISNEYEVIGGTDTKYIFTGNLRVAKVSATGVYYFHKDHLGSSTVMTGNTGGVVETSEYRPYGSFRSLTGTGVSDYKFTDQELDNSTNLYNYDARLYDPVIGRFLSADTIVPDPFDPQLLNRFSYVRNNPLIYVDPSGHHLGGDNGPDHNTESAFGGHNSDRTGSADPGNGLDFSDNPGHRTAAEAQAELGHTVVYRQYTIKDGKWSAKDYINSKGDTVVSRLNTNSAYNGSLAKDMLSSNLGGIYGEGIEIQLGIIPLAGPLSRLSRLPRAYHKVKELLGFYRTKTGYLGKPQPYSRLNGQWVKNRVTFAGRINHYRNTTAGHLTVGFFEGYISDKASIEEPPAISGAQRAGQFVGKAFSQIGF